MYKKSQILDEWLVLKAQEGDQQAFRQLVIKWHKKLLYQSHIRTKDWHEAEDIVQEVWQWVLGNLNKLKETSKFGAWIRTIVDRRSIDWVRKQQKQRDNQYLIANGFNETDQLSLTDTFDTATDTHENQLKVLELTLNQLNAESKLVLVLYYLESHSIESIAGILNIPKGTVKSRLFHAREKLKSLMKTKEL